MVTRGTGDYADSENRTKPVRGTAATEVNAEGTLTSRTFNYVTDCFGSVGTITSVDNETATEFTSIKEAKRLAP